MDVTYKATYEVLPEEWYAGAIPYTNKNGKKVVSLVGTVIARTDNEARNIAKKQDILEGMEIVRLLSIERIVTSEIPLR